MEPSLLASVAAALLAFGLVSRKAENSIVTPPMVFVLLGLALSPYGLGWLHIEDGQVIVHGLAEITLALVLFTDASRIDLTCLRLERSIPLRLLGIGLPLTIALGAVTAVAILPGLGIWEALLLAALLAPTDAALGQVVVSSPLLPVRIRQSLNVESGLNDGIALPVVLVIAFLAGARAEGGDLVYWLRFAIAQVVLGPIVGAAVGYVGGRCVEWAARAGWITDAFERLTVLGLAALAFAGAELVGGNGFIAAFVAGLVLGNTARGICRCLYEFGEAEGQLLTLLVFLIFGGVMLPEAIPAWGLPALAYALASLTFIRMLPVAASLLGSGLRPSSVIFLAWFGPRGLASILFALLVVEERRLQSGEMLQSVVALTVFLSILAHGVSAHPYSRRYAALLARTRDRTAPENVEVPELPVRTRYRVGESAG